MADSSTGLLFQRAPSTTPVRTLPVVVTPSCANKLGTWIKASNLDENNEGFPQQATLAKNETVPSVHGGILWSDAANKVLYQYGGEYGNGKPEDFKLWFYDIIYNTWNISNATTTDISRASWGMLVFVFAN